MAKKTSVKITGVKEIGKAVNKSIKMISADTALFKDMGQYTVNNITAAAKQGKDPNGTALADIGDSWNKRRKSLAKVNETDEFYKPNSKRSRLTFTGQLLKSFSYTFSSTGLTLSFFFKGNRKPYKGIRKPALEGPSTNAELAEKVEIDRPFVFLSERMRTVLISKVIKSLRQRLRNYKKLSRLLG